MPETKIGSRFMDRVSAWAKDNPRPAIIIGVACASYLGLGTTIVWINNAVPARQYAPVFDRPVSYIPGGADCQMSMLAKMRLPERQRKQDMCDQAAMDAYHAEVQTVTALRQADNSDTQTKSSLLQAAILFFTLVPTSIGALIGALPSTRSPGKKTKAADENTPIGR